MPTSIRRRHGIAGNQAGTRGDVDRAIAASAYLVSGESANDSHRMRAVCEAEELPRRPVRRADQLVHRKHILHRRCGTQMLNQRSSKPRAVACRHGTGLLSLGWHFS